QARCPAGRRKVLDARVSEGTEGPLQPDPAALLRAVVLLEEQARSKGPARVPRHAYECRETGRGEPGLRHSAVSQVQRLQDLGRGGAAQGLDLALSDQGWRSGGWRHLFPGAAADRGPNLVPGDPVPDDRPVRP